MTIFSQLEKQSKMDLDFLNRAMLILYQVQSIPTTEQFIKDKISKLEEEVTTYLRNDERFGNSTVPIDLSRWEFKERK